MLVSRVMNTEQSIQEAGRIWRKTVGDVFAMKKRVRAEAEAQIEHEVEVRRIEAARVIHYALDHGATKTALRKMTTKDHWDFESYVDFGNELAAKEAGE